MMANATLLGNFLKSELDLSTKIANLEDRASNLENDFSAITSAARELATVVRRYVDRVETEKKSWDLLDSILDGKGSARDVLDHVKIFFNFMLAKMATRNAEITDIKMLWHLIETEGVKQVFHDVLKTFGFRDSDAGDVKLLLAVTYKLHVDMERQPTADDKHSSSDNVVVKLSAEDLQELVEKVQNQLNNLKLVESVERSSAVEVNVERKDEPDQSAAEKEHTSGQALEKLIYTVDNWQFDDNLKQVARKIVGIVVYALKVRRENKTLSIIVKRENQDIKL